MKNISCVAPLFYENKFVANFKENADLFSFFFFFANQCTLLNNSSVLPNNLAKLTNKSLDSVNFSSDVISKIINNADLNKAHGHDMLRIWIIKLYGNSICKPLLTIFNDCLKGGGGFPSDWKKAHVVPVHKIGNKQCLNYKPISLLPICSKISECLIYDEPFTFFTDNMLISPNQSGFRPGDSCVNQLLAITH